ncbi:MAG: hypothetical protein GDA44_09235 [Prochloron sp. SP5CPC1]|nr:hypothetical protein [Candidatus Paraprochloron terpiosi SP5CPC1]
MISKFTIYRDKKNNQSTPKPEPEKVEYLLDSLLDLVEETNHQVDKVDKADNNQVYIEEEKWEKTTKKESKGTEERVKELEQLHDLLGDLVRPEKRDRLRQVERQVNKRVNYPMSICAL